MSEMNVRWPPLTEKEKGFISFWEKERDRQKKWTWLITHNVRWGILFGAPIAIFFMAEAPRHRSLITHTDLVLIMLCIVLIIVFYAVFRGYSNWEQSDAHYKILKMREENKSSDNTLPPEDKK